MTRSVRTSRGMTFLEVVAAVAILALVAGMFGSVMSFVQGSSMREAQRLGAAELANRLILQFMDDKDSLPSSSFPLEYDRFRYRWSMDEERVRSELNTAAVATAANRTGGFSLDRIKLITVRVWLSDESGGSFAFDENVPGVTLKRLVDPLAFSNPDSTENLLQSDQGIQELIRTIMETEGGAIGGGASGRDGGQGGGGRGGR